MPAPYISDAALADFIRASLPLLPVPAIPEIRLHKAMPDSGLGRFLGETNPSPPYWAHYWGGGLALARYVLNRPELVRHRRVLDLGAGSGLVAIAAALAGAACVMASEIDLHAIAAMRLNLQANAAIARIIHRDVLDDPPLPVDIVLVGDLFYDRTLADRVIRHLDRCIEARVEVLVGDPYRAFLPHERLRRVADFLISESPRAPKSAGVFRYGSDRAIS